MNRALYYILIVCLSFIWTLRLNAGQYVFSHFSTRNGLSSNHIHDITQDKNGFLWIASHYGICRFNGTSFKNFTTVDYPTMYRNDIYHAFMMKDGNVTFGSSRGVLVSYNNQKDAFRDCSPTDSFYHDITGYTLGADGEELISTRAGIYSFSKELNKFQFVPIVPKGTSVFELSKDRLNRYWVGHTLGVKIYTNNGEKVSGFEVLESINEQINNICQLDSVTTLLCSPIGSFWMVKTDISGHYKKLTKIHAPFKNISEICPDGRNIWIGTSGAGLWKAIYNNDQFSFERCMPINRDDSDLRKISALFKDADGNIWVGTQNTGIWRITHVMDTDVAFSSDLGLPMVTGSSFFENNRHEILLGTDGQGLFVLDSIYNIRKHLTEGEGLSSTSILSIQPYQNQCLLAYWGGNISCLDAMTLQNRKIPFSGIQDPSYTAKFADVAPNGNIWVCLSGEGIYTTTNAKKWERYSFPTNSTFSQNNPDRNANHVCFAKNCTWIATTRTIWRIDNKGNCKPLFPDTEKDVSHNPLEIHQVAVDQKDNCYAVAGNGVYRFSPEKDVFEKLEFLPSGAYSAIYCDSDNKIWTSGINGIISFNYEKKTYSNEVDILSDYDRDFFIPRAIYKDSKNRLYFGTKQGFVVINTNIKPKQVKPFVEWSDLSFRGVKVKVDSTGLLPASLSSIKQLNLAYDQTDISLKFEVVNLTSYNNTTAYYRINGLDTTWIPVDEDQTIGITQLSPGEYKLQVRFLNKGEIVDDVQLEMGLNVSPPWWQTWWFYTLLVLVITVTALLIFYSRIKRITKQKIELEQKVTERTQELCKANLSLQQREKEVELQNDMLHRALKDKDQLVSIIAHDLKNPMFSIVGSLGDLLKKPEEKDNILLRQVFHASSVLQGQMLKLLDWATENKITASCEFQNINIKDIVAEVTALIQGLINDKNIKLKVDINVSHYIYADPRMLSTIIRNLLTNAIKFTPEGRSISLKAFEKDDFTVVTVSDQGVGMSEETIAGLNAGMRITKLGTASEKGYGLGFSIIQEFVKQNNGTLNISSKLGEGTDIEVSLVRTDIPIVTKKDKVSAPHNANIEIDKELLEGKTILIVDDDPLIVLHVKSLLSEFVNVLTAENGEEGLQLAKNNIPDLIISDVDMPKMNGMEMFDAIRANSLTSNIPFLFISAINEESLRIRGLSQGAIDYIPKPFNEKELVIKACNVLSVLKKQQLSILLGAMNDDQPQTEEVNPLLEQLLDIVKEHYQEPGYSFDDMANALGLSKSTLTRRLKSLTDKSPVEILSDYRLNKAKQMLVSGNASVSDVAYAVGFSDPLYFSRKFKDAFGCPPSRINNLL